MMKGHSLSYQVGYKNAVDKFCDILEDCLPNIEYITNASALRQNKKQFIESLRKLANNE